MSTRCIIILILAAEFLLGQDVDTTAYKNPKKAFLFSLSPGGGQLYNGKWVKAIMFIGLEAAATKSWLENSHIYNDYDNGNYPLRKHRYLEKRNKYGWWMGFIYLFGMLDAVVDAHLQPFDEIMNTTLESTQKEENQDAE